MTTAWVPLATTTLGASASSVTFSSIPSGYRDLILVVAGTGSSSGSIRIQMNNDTGSNYTYVDAFGNGSSAASSSGTLTSAIVADLYATESNGIAHIMDYSATYNQKTILARGNAASGIARMVANRWANTSAVTEIDVFPSSGNFNSGSTISLYGSNRL